MERKLNKLPVLLLVLFLVTACSLAGGESTQAPEATTVPEEAAQVEVTEEPVQPAGSAENMPVPGNGPCANPYYPVREGSTWNFTSTNTLADDYSFTDTITSVSGDGYTLTTQFDGLTRTQEWACTPAGLVAVQMGGGLTTAGSNLTVETQNASGVTYPATMNTGDTWQYELGFTGTMDIAGQAGDATGSTQSDFTALGEESVTVTAGTFEAMKVQAVTTFSANVTFQGMTVPVTFTSTTISWFVEGVGWVKSESTGDIAGQGYTETIELQWYNIP